MTKKEYLEKISEKEINAEKVDKIQKAYGSAFSKMVQKIISNSEETVFFDDGYRILSYNEIFNAENELHVDFKNKGILPIADCGENDFIVYHFLDGIWSKFNIIDETVFKKKDGLDGLLK